jgi:hypothetical protein
LVKPVHSTVALLADDGGVQSAAARSTTAKVEIAAASITAHRRVNSFGVAGFIAIPNRRPQFGSADSDIDHPSAIQRPLGGESRCTRWVDTGKSLDASAMRGLDCCDGGSGRNDTATDCRQLVQFCDIKPLAWTKPAVAVAGIRRRDLLKRASSGVCALNGGALLTLPLRGRAIAYDEIEAHFTQRW